MPGSRQGAVPYRRCAAHVALSDVFLFRQGPARTGLYRASLSRRAEGRPCLVRGKEPFLTADALRMSRYLMYFSSAKARRELGYTARPYREGLKDAHAWFAARSRSLPPMRCACRAI